MISPLLERRQVLRAKQNPRPSQGEWASIVQGGNPASRFRSPSSRPAQPSAVASAKFQGWKPSSIHIELGDSDHGPMAERLVEDLCGDDPARWRSAEEAAVRSLEPRRDLWDAIDLKYTRR
jgi:Protein of unknown function (DUF3050)